MIQRDDDDDDRDPTVVLDSVIHLSPLYFSYAAQVEIEQTLFTKYTLI